jgi:beta-hydroxylase
MAAVPLPWILLGTHALTGIYVHFRGRVRFGFLRQLTDHSTLLAPLNTLLYLSSKVPAQAFVDPSTFPQLKLLADNWQTIRDECLGLTDAGAIKASDGYNDAGFNSFFKTGWKRFYLCWYGTPHQSALERCPRTVALLRAIPDVPGDKIGWINRMFGTVYQVRLLGKAFRKRSKLAYYTLKLATLAAILYWVAYTF